MATLDQKRAQHALAKLNNVVADQTADNAKYKTFAKDAPAKIHLNGLIQTLAFLHVKRNSNNQGEKTAARYLITSLNDWLRAYQLLPREAVSLFTWLANTATTDQYQHATSEAIAYLTWTKRLAEAHTEEPLEPEE